ncbi:putative NreB protein [Candidatus Rhodobacter oscarellae]|uniref:Putative NreB protein n=1 Tax=Candidatus Rhodobacter oscarellae TaxID=1675527 RepID=A0A0J9ECF4_9RHOB|nr:MFS transporter [Candidatus Rhodobacter lobularis]KMW60457.1 putative NreB protein [Candidatus Rhodobacter lobularis]
MQQVLSHPIFRRLFAAQVIALVGTGLLTVALGLLAFDIAGAQAGRVLGIALTIKMVAYVGLSPLITALVARMDRRRVLIAADMVRAGAALALPFIDAAWQIYVLILVLQAASATFSPTFQAVIPEVLPDEGDYTRALSLSRLAYDIENLTSPALAALLLTVLAPSWLFAGTVLGFLASAWLVLGTALPARAASRDRPFLERVTRGSRIYLATPRLRGLLALNVTVSAVGAIVLVQSVVVARGAFGGSARDLAVLLGAYGLGSVLVALCLPRVLDRLRDRVVMMLGAVGLAAVMLLAGLTVLLAGWPGWGAVLLVWAALGACNAAIMTPSGRLLRRSAHAEDRPAIFAAQFALSHACWLLAYPLAGLLGAHLGLGVTMSLMGAIGAGGVILALVVWPPNTAEPIEHSHDDLPPGHPHLRGARRVAGAWVHAHAFVIDDEHHAWPTNG